MKHTHETLIKSIDYLLPDIKKAKDLGVKFNTPQLLSMIAEDFFVKSIDILWNPRFNTRIAYFVCQEALIDLKTVGYFEFGEQTFDFN